MMDWCYRGGYGVVVEGMLECSWVGGWAEGMFARFHWRSHVIFVAKSWGGATCRVHGELVECWYWFHNHLMWVMENSYRPLVLKVVGGCHYSHGGV